MHDAAYDIIEQVNANAERRTEHEFYDCLLCGATMYPSMDYTHEKDCPYELLTKAIDAFGDAIEKIECAATTAEIAA
jgi:hypothetical protein